MGKTSLRSWYDHFLTTGVASEALLLFLLSLEFLGMCDLPFVLVARKKTSSGTFSIVRDGFLGIVRPILCHSARDSKTLFPGAPMGTTNILQESPLEGDWLPTPPGSTVCLTSNGHLLHQQAHTSTSRLEALASTLLC